MDCTRAQKLAAETLPSERLPAGVRRHLAACSRCREEASSTRRLFEEIAGLPAPDPGEEYWSGFSARVRRRIGAPSGPRRLRLEEVFPGRLAWIAAASAAALLLVAAVLWRPGVISSGDGSEDGDLALLETRLRAALRRADPAALADIDSLGSLLGPPGEGGLELPMSEEESDRLVGIEALAAAGELAAAFRTEGFPEWSGMDHLVEGLGPAEAARLEEDLSRDGAGALVEGEGGAG